MRHARAARDLSHRDESRSVFANDAANTVEKGRAKVAVVVVAPRRDGRRPFGHGRTLPEMRRGPHLDSVKISGLECGTPGEETVVKLLYGVACQLVTIFVVLQTVRFLWSREVRKSS